METFIEKSANFLNLLFLGSRSRLEAHTIDVAPDAYLTATENVIRLTFDTCEANHGVVQRRTAPLHPQIKNLTTAKDQFATGETTLENTRAKFGRHSPEVGCDLFQLQCV